MRFPAWRTCIGAAAVFFAACTPALTQTPLHVKSGFALERIATVSGAREIAATPNGDLLVGTTGNDVYIVPQAQGRAGAPRVFAHLPDSPAASVLTSGGFVYIGTQFDVWRAPYDPGDRAVRAPLRKIQVLRTNGVASDHLTTTLAVTGGRLFASVGSSCDACDPEIDDTRATVQEMALDGSGAHARAIHIRNAIALAVSPGGALWAGVAGQDALAHGHPYEIFDPVTAHPRTADYGWPRCYENHRAVTPRTDCSQAVVPRVVFPAYETPIGAAFYPLHPSGRHAFPTAYAGGAFVALHGSWHRPLLPPRLVFVPMNDDAPRRPVDWNDPAAQWSDFVTGFQTAGDARPARPTGVCVGADGSLYFADDEAGGIYRIRPAK